MHSTETLVRKYTGVTVRFSYREDSHGQSVLNEIFTTALSLESTEHQLAESSLRLAETTSRISQNLSALPGEPVRHLNPIGEVQAIGNEVDALIAKRQAKIEHLQSLVRLLPEPTSGPSPVYTNALAEAGRGDSSDGSIGGFSGHNDGES